MEIEKGIDGKSVIRIYIRCGNWVYCTIFHYIPVLFPLFVKSYPVSCVLADIAKAHGKSIVQVILRWHWQRNVVAIPGSSNPAHIAENHDIFDFELTDDEMNRIASLNRNEKHDWY